MARPLSDELPYLPLKTDFLSRDWMLRITSRFSSLGLAVYVALQTIVFQNGSYARMSRIQLEREIMHRVNEPGQGGIEHSGRKRKKATVGDVIDYFLQEGFLDKKSLDRGIVTSAWMQQSHRDSCAAMRRRLDSENYWLLEAPENAGEPEGVLNAPENQVIATETAVSVAETTVSTEENGYRKEKKRNKGIDIYAAAAALDPPLFEDAATNAAFLAWLKKRVDAGAIATMEDVELARRQLLGLSDDPREILNAAVCAAMGNWKFFHSRTEKHQGKKAGKTNAAKKNAVGAFGHYEQRDFDYRDVEKKMRGYDAMQG